MGKSETRLEQPRAFLHKNTSICINMQAQDVNELRNYFAVFSGQESSLAARSKCL